MHAFLDEAQELFEYTQGLRRDFHRHPELGFQERRTASIVAGELSKLGLKATTGVAETGVVALIEGAQPGRVVLLRFDMDALPITEQTGAEYASLNEGVMHACGHDGHTAVGLTVARLLHAHRQELRGAVKLVFQPAEEGLGGAPRMVAQGVLENPRPDISLAMHVWNEKAVGWIGVTPGPAMAAAEKFKLRIIGKGGHAAAPHLAVDPVLASAQVINGLQSIVSRNVAPLQTAVISVATIHGGEAFNVIPPQVEMQGTIRTFEPDTRAMLLQRFGEMVEGVAASFGCRSEIEMEALTPAVINDPKAAAMVQRLAPQIVPACDLDATTRTMGSEDMAYIMRETPGCFVFVGSANPEKGLDAAHHHPNFDFDERALTYGAALLTAAAVEFLGSAE
ncbi:MAG: amidohydrolase [Anaerolineales bacterium]|nr:amidohydrolase [Anaerolineales bacterium]